MNKSEARELLLKSDVKLHPMSWVEGHWITMDRDTMFLIDDQRTLKNWNVFKEEAQFEIYNEPKAKVMHYRRAWVAYDGTEVVDDNPYWLKTKNQFDERYADSNKSEEWEEKEFEIE